MSGVKFLPPGLHLFVLGSPASATSLTSTRHAFFHFVQPQTTLIRQWDVEEEKLLPSEDLSTSRTAVNSSSTGDVISQDHLRSLDAHLAPYPYDRRRKWEALSSCIDAACLARVLGFKSNGDALVDGLQLLTSEAPKPVKQQWGKPRREEEEQHKAAEPQPAAPETLGFAQFDLKRSWPPQAVGEDLTKHSRDKQWLREQVIAQVGGERPRCHSVLLSLLPFPTSERPLLGLSFRSTTTSGGIAARLLAVHSSHQLQRPRRVPQHAQPAVPLIRLTQRPRHLRLTSCHPARSAVFPQTRILCRRSA